MRNLLMVIPAAALSLSLSLFSVEAFGEEDKNLAFIKKCENVIQYGDPNAAHEPSTVHAIVALGLLGDERAVEPLCAVLLNHRNDNVRHHTARALGWIKSDKAVPALEKALSDRYRWTKDAAARSLFDITGKKHQPKYTAAELEEIKRFEEELKRLDLEPPAK
jgi:hypothetical protein